MNTNPPEIPREKWESHPNYPSQVLLLGSHRNFRSVSAALVKAAREGTDPAIIMSVYVRWIGGMRSHEAYEERKLYPYLSRRWGVSFDASEDGHEELHQAHDEVLSAFESGVGLADALANHDQILIEHLAIEEEQVIPLLLSLSPEEFDNYYHGRF